MPDFLSKLFDTSDFPPRWHCGNWTLGHGWLHILSDLGVWSAYLAIPCVLGYFILRRRDLPFRRVFGLFVAFILACGSTHLMEAIIFWWPAYRLAGVIKLFTAIVSWGTVLAMIPIVPLALAMRSPEELEREVKERRDAEEKLQRSYAELEERVSERTEALAAANQTLQAEVLDRIRAEEELRRVQAGLEETVATRTSDLARANDFLNALLESIQDGIAACDANGILTLFNRAATVFHGLPPEPIPADQWSSRYDLYRADGQTPLPTEEIPLYRALNGERLHNVEMVIAPKNGTPRTMLASGQAFHDDRGEKLGAVVSMHDITDRKQADAALRKAHEELERRVAERTAELQEANEALRLADRRKEELLASLRDGEERFRTMAESIPQLAWMARPDGHIYWYNKRWYEYTGTYPEAMEGWGWQSVHDPAVLPAVLERWKASLVNGEPFDMVFPLRGADGVFRPFLTRVMPVRDADGNVAHWFGTNTDISDRLRIEEELRAARDEAEAASQAKTQFLAVLSHELRTPLNPILLAASAMLERPADPAELHSTFEMIKQNVSLQARLIDDLLDVMRIVRGKMPLQWGIADCHALIDHAVGVCRGEFQERHIKVETHLSAAQSRVNADAARLQQVFWNLLKNAVKFSPEGAAVTIRTRNGLDPLDGSELIVVEIADNGIGIEPQILPRVFDPFQQGETTITRKFGGLGLGLAISKGIVDAHGGKIVAESLGAGLGTTFRIEMKTLPEDPGPLIVGASGRKTVRSAEGQPPLRILVVEDEPVTLRLMTKLLGGLGHTVSGADSVASALRIFQTGEFDLIVSDIGLPDGTGLDLMRQIVALRGRIPAVALTGYGMEDDILRSREAGFASHMTKPINFTKLNIMIRRITASNGFEAAETAGSVQTSD